MTGLEQTHRSSPISDREDLVTQATTQWARDSVASQLPRRQEAIESLSQLTSSVDQVVLDKLLPSLSKRPLLLMAVCLELASVNSSEAADLIAASPILQILHAPYRPIFLQDRHLVEQADSCAKTILEKIYEMVSADPAPGLNSTLRNTLLADRLNLTALKGSSYSAEMALAQYSWGGVNSQVASYPLPHLPHGALEGVRIKLLVALADRGEVQRYLDYGHGEGLEHYGRRPTGEGIQNVAGHLPPHKRYSLAAPGELDEALRIVTQGQERVGEREAVRRIGLNQQMIASLLDYGREPGGHSFPNVVASVDDLDPGQITHLLKWAGLVEEFIEQRAEPPALHEIESGVSGAVCTLFQGSTVWTEFVQPSTRTANAAADAERALGLIQLHTTESSRAKGERHRSEGEAFAAHKVRVVLRRSEAFEREAAEQRKRGDAESSVHISLGGNEHHPMQTLAEIKVLMDFFGCKSYLVNDLRSITFDAPPTITFLGRVDQKRADKALIRFILEHLPEWQIRVVVPFEEDLPKFELPANAKYTASCVQNLTDQSVLEGAVAGSTFLYVSNAEATANAALKGQGDGLRPPVFYVSAPLVERLGVRVLHPLPGSNELDEEIFNSPLSLIRPVMQAKIHVIASTIAHALAGRQARASNHS